MFTSPKANRLSFFLLLCFAFAPCCFAENADVSKAEAARVRPFSTVGVEAVLGVGGLGADFAVPVAQKFNLRAGGTYFNYGMAFQEQGANIQATLTLRSGHASMDWFPFGGSFRLSPLVVFANNNGARGTALVPAGSSITLSGGDYSSSESDPLHGSASVNFRKVAPGFSLGFGNIVPRTHRHFSFPTEAGFYYVAQPGLKVAFTGSACDATQPAATGCEAVAQDAGFKASLAGFLARNQHNLSYASFFPIVSSGVGFRF